MADVRRPDGAASPQSG